MAKTTPATMPVKFWTDGNVQLLSLSCDQQVKGSLHMPHARGSLPGKGTEILKQLLLHLPQQHGLPGKSKETIQLLEYGLPGEGTKQQTTKQNQQTQTHVSKYLNLINLRSSILEALKLSFWKL